MPEQSYSVRFGDPERQREFANRHIELLKRLDSSLKETVDIALKGADTKSNEHKVLYSLARIVMEDDFNSLLLLCANGYSNSAMTILRGMFERSVTLTYLSEHPDEIALFQEYFWIDRKKRLPDYIKEYGDKISQESRQETQENFDRIKGNYEITACKRCKTKRLNHMWSKKDIITMAKESGFVFQLIEMAYYNCLEEAHPKVNAMLRRFEYKEDDSLWYKERPDLEDADEYFMLAHFLVLKCLEVIKNYFRIEALEQPLSDRLQDFGEVWEWKRIEATQEE